MNTTTLKAPSNSTTPFSMGHTKYEHVNPINHEPCVGFQFLKLFWNPYTISKPSYQITFMIRGILKNLIFFIFSVKTFL